MENQPCSSKHSALHCKEYFQDSSCGSVKRWINTQAIIRDLKVYRFYIIMSQKTRLDFVFLISVTSGISEKSSTFCPYSSASERIKHA